MARTPEQEEKVALEGTNSVVDIVPNAHRYSILQDGDGLFLSSADGELAFVEHVDDSAVWDAAEGGQYRHPLTGAVVDLAEHGVTAEWYALRRLLSCSAMTSWPLNALSLISCSAMTS